MRSDPDIKRDVEDGRITRSDVHIVLHEDCKSLSVCGDGVLAGLDLLPYVPIVDHFRISQPSNFNWPRIAAESARLGMSQSG